MNLQPSELAKVVARALPGALDGAEGAAPRTFSLGVLPHFIVARTLAALVVVEPDFGTAALLGVAALAMLFVGGVRWRHPRRRSSRIVPLAIYAVSSSPYRLRRVMVFLDPWEHPRDAGFQLVQSFLAFGSGGRLRRGARQSKQKMFYLPEAHTGLHLLGDRRGARPRSGRSSWSASSRCWRSAASGSRSTTRRSFGQLVAFGTTTVLVVAGRHQHGGRAGSPADEGPRAAVRELRRLGDARCR